MAAIIISSRLVLAFLALLLAPAPAARAQDQTATAAGALPTGSGRWAPGVINGLWTAFKGTVANGSQPIAYLSATLTNKDIVTLVGATTEPAQHAPITGVGYYFSQRYKQSKTKAATDSSHKVYNNWPSYKVFFSGADGGWTTIVAVDKNTLIAYDGGDPDPLPNPPTPLPDSWVLVRGDKTG